MKISCLLFLLSVMLGAAASAPAQSITPKVEIYAGYDYLRYSFAANGASPSFSVGRNGGSVQAEYNADRWLGIVGDAGVYDSQIGGGAFSYLLGPRLNLRHKRITPFAQVLAGGFIATHTLNHFAFTAGGGVDCKVSQHIAIRPAQVEYFMTRQPDGVSNRQNGFRFSSGVVLRLGGDKAHSPKG